MIVTTPMKHVNKNKIPWVFPIGNEYDYSIDMREELVLTSGRVDVPEIKIKDKIFQTPRKTSSSHLSNTTPRRVKSTSKMQHSSPKINTCTISDRNLENTGRTYYKESSFSTPRFENRSRTPVIISRFGSRYNSPDNTPLQSPRSPRYTQSPPKSPRPDFPEGKVQTYLFEFDNPKRFIPKKFVSTLRPKTPRGNRSQSQLEKEKPQVYGKSSRRLSPSRPVKLSANVGDMSLIVNMELDEIRKSLSK